jgi:Holliday junction resolvase RusA-like endonuclease
MLSFFIKCKPPRSTNQSSKRVGVRKNGKPFSYTTAKGKAQEQDFMSLLMPHVPNQPMEGPLILTIVYKLPLLKTEKKAIRDKGWIFHDKKPDADNLVKMFQDTMGKLRFWQDDSQVVQLYITKLRHENCGIEVEIDHVQE